MSGEASSQKHAGQREAQLRVLVVAYYFPPAGGAAVQRMLKLVKYLGDFGYAPTVLTVRDGAFSQRDPALAADVPPEVEVHRTRAFDPFSVYARMTGRTRQEAVTVGTVQRGDSARERLARWLRANVFLPDARVGWVPFAIQEGLRLHREQPFDVVLTSGPPHSLHLIGRALKRRAGLPWVADFRDPWVGINFYHELPMTEAAQRLDRRLERSVLREADRLTTVSPSWREMLIAHGGRDPEAVAVVHNGFDAEDFGGSAPALPDETFVLAHVGSLYGTRNPEALWTALARLRAEGRIERLRLRLVGTVDASVRAALVAHGLEDLIEVTPPVPHAEAIAAMRAATALLLVIEPYPSEAGMITAKLYEYLASGRPVVGLGWAEGDAAVVLAETDAGRLFDRADADGLAAHLGRLYDAWTAGDDLAGASAKQATPYTRRAQTGAMAAVLSEAMREASGSGMAERV